MTDLIAKHGAVVGATPLLSERGQEAGAYTLTTPAGQGDAFVTLNCAGPGTYTVKSGDDVLLGSDCTGSAVADIRLPLDVIGTAVSVQAPGAFWILIAPAT